jgi:hypothetical protein
LKKSPAEGLASAVVQSNFKDVAKPCPVGTSVDCDCVQVPRLLWYLYSIYLKYNNQQ